MEEQMSYEQLKKLKANPHYKLSQKQQAMLAQYEANQFKVNGKFTKHPIKLEEKPDNGQSDSN